MLSVNYNNGQSLACFNTHFIYWKFLTQQHILHRAQNKIYLLLMLFLIVLSLHYFSPYPNLQSGYYVALMFLFNLHIDMKLTDNETKLLDFLLLSAKFHMK